MQIYADDGNYAAGRVGLKTYFESVYLTLLLGKP